MGVPVTLGSDEFKDNLETEAVMGITDFGVLCNDSEGLEFGTVGSDLTGDEVGANGSIFALESTGFEITTTGF